MALRIVAFVVIACLSGSQGARTSFRATLQASELSHLQMLIANTTKALKESQAASAAEKKTQTTEKKPEATAAEKKAPAAEKKAPVAEKKAPEAEKKAMLIANTTKALKESQNASANEKKAPSTEKKAEAPAATKEVPAAKKNAPETEKEASVGKHAFAQHVTKERQALIIKQLSAEEDTLDKNLKAIKAEQKLDNSKEKIEGGKHLQSMMKGKDADMLKHFDDFTKHANAKAAVGAQDVLSKLKHMIHFIKKGALSGDDKAANGLDGLLKDMSGMIR